MRMLREQKSRGAASLSRRLQIVVLVLGGILFAYACTTPPKSTTAEVPLPIPSPVPSVTTVVASTQGDYSRFTHSNDSHSRLPCLLCHVRDDNSSRLTLPGKVDHLPCAGCHVAQLADQSSPMCTICHTDAQTGAVKSFPPIRSFDIKFDHARHVRQTNCATCHEPAARGVALSVPKGASAHTTCFQCHTSTTPIGSCNTCHSPGRPVRASEWARAFEVNFSHQEHTRKGNMTCTTCHTVLAGSARGLQVSSPAASMHHASARGQSCAACHNNKRAFGPGDFANCKRCHEGNTFKF